jgi:hypothetical protein
MKKLHLTLMKFVFVLIMGAVAFDYWTLLQLTKESLQLQREGYDRYTATFIQEQSDLKGWDFLPDHRCENDVGPMLNPLIKWDGDVSQTDWAKAQDVESNFGPPINREILQTAKREGWAAVLTATEEALILPEGGTLDFTWWDETAHNYDCWNIDVNSPRMELIASMDATAVPIPMVVDIMDWNILRLASGYKDNDNHTALRSLRGWTQLLMSSENLVNVMVGIALLKHEADHLQFLREQGIIIEGWVGVDHKTVKMLRRVGMASSAYTGLYTPEDYLDVTVSLFPCVALSEGLTLGSIFGPAERQAFPIQLTNFEQQLASSPSCKLKALKSKWAQEKEAPLSIPPEFICDSTSSLSCIAIREFDVVPFWSKNLLSKLSMSYVVFPFSKYVSEDPKQSAP